MRDNVFAALRQVIRWLTFYRPQERRVETDRWLRGREE